MVNRLNHLVGSRIGNLAPGSTSAVVQRALIGALRGVGPLKGAAAAADAQLVEQGGHSRADVEAAVHDVIANHVRLAGAQGFATNIGGLVTLSVTVPANIAGLSLLQCRMVAAIAHLHGYDLDDPRVRNAVLTCILGRDEVTRLVARNKLPGPPHDIATDEVRSGDLDRVVAVQVATSVLARVAGRRLATTVGKRVPLVGGLVGAASDAWSTRAVGRYAAAELAASTQLAGSF